MGVKAFQEDFCQGQRVDQGWQLVETRERWGICAEEDYDVDYELVLEVLCTEDRLD